MGRLRAEFLERVESFSDRVLRMAEALERQKRSHRLIDQIAASGTSVGANAFEADEALSRPDFCKSIGIALKELAETRFWIRIVARRKWIAPKRLEPLEAECIELKRILGAMVVRTRRNTEHRTI